MKYEARFCHNASRTIWRHAFPKYLLKTTLDETIQEKQSSD